EVFRDDDVGRLLGPEGGDLDVLLLEDDFPLFVADDGRADLPFDLVERVDARQREVALKVETLYGCTCRLGVSWLAALLRARFDGSAVSLGRPSFHARPPNPARTYPCGCARKSFYDVRPGVS